MAETEAAGAAGDGLAQALKHKVGPFPVVVWVAGLGGVWYVMQRRNKGAGTGANQQTDPAGNVGSIDPSTGYVYGTPEDQAALASNNAGGGSGTAPGSTGDSTTAGQYADNDAWARAAINYLVGIGVDPTAANAAIQSFLASQSLTANQQADVNLAIQRIGAPPTPPTPDTAPSPIVTPPSPGTVYATNPPTGLTVSSKSSTSLGIKWNSTTNAKGYVVHWGPTASAFGGSQTVTGTKTSTTITGLKANTHYFIRVQASPAKGGAPFASTSATTTKASGTKPPTKPPAKGGQHFTTVTVVKWRGPGPNTPWNSTLSGIAEHYHVKGGAAELGKINHISNLNLIHVGQHIKVPVE
jgi:hypothetical protein